MHHCFINSIITFFFISWCYQAFCHNIIFVSVTPVTFLSFSFFVDELKPSSISSSLLFSCIHQYPRVPSVWLAGPAGGHQSDCPVPDWQQHDPVDSALHPPGWLHPHCRPRGPGACSGRGICATEEKGHFQLCLFSDSPLYLLRFPFSWSRCWRTQQFGLWSSWSSCTKRMGRAHLGLSSGLTCVAGAPGICTSSVPAGSSPDAAPANW